MASTKITRAAGLAAVITACAALAALSGCGPSHKVYAQRMNSTSVAERRAAAKELRVAKRDPKLVPVILQACRDSDPDVRMYAFFALGRVNPHEEGVVVTLIAGTTDTSVDVRRAVAASMGELNPFPSACIPYMVKMLTDKDAKVRNMVVNAFSDLEGQGVGTLLRHIDSKDVEQRLAIVNVLGLIGTPAKSALTRLKRMSTDDDDLRVREAAARAVKLVEK